MGNDVIVRENWGASTVIGSALQGDWNTSAHAAAVAVPDDLSLTLADGWQRGGGVALHLAIAQGAASNVLATVGWAEEFVTGFDALPEAVREAVIGELSLGGVGSIRNASEAEVGKFAEDEDGRVLVAEWRYNAPRKVAIVKQRIGRILAGLCAEDAEAAATWFSELPASTAQAILRELGK